MQTFAEAALLELAKDVEEMAPLTAEELLLIGGGHATVNTI